MKDEGIFVDYGFFVWFYIKGGFIFLVFYEIICKCKYYNFIVKDDIFIWLSKKIYKLFSL